MDAFHQSRRTKEDVMERLLNKGSLGRSTATLSTGRRGEAHACGMDLFAPRHYQVPQLAVPPVESAEEEQDLSAPEFGWQQRMAVQASVL